MNTWNTLSKGGAGLLDRAITVLETLSKDKNQALLDFLMDSKQASITEISFATGLPEKQVEFQIRQISLTGALDVIPTPGGEVFILNKGRLSEISAIAGQIHGIGPGEMAPAY